MALGGRRRKRAVRAVEAGDAGKRGERARRVIKGSARRDLHGGANESESMSDDLKTTPTSVKAPHGARVMEIQWADGHKAILPHEILRGYCPCALCQGHGGQIKYVPGGDLDLRDIQQVGNYALQFTWGDRHDTGIYTFRYLRSLCQCDECKPTFRAERSP